MTGNDDRDQARIFSFQFPMDTANNGLLTGVGTRSEPTGSGSNVIPKEI